jgi:hypothetical protein
LIPAIQSGSLNIRHLLPVRWLRASYS